MRGRGLGGAFEGGGGGGVFFFKCSLITYRDRGHKQQLTRPVRPCPWDLYF